MPPRFATISLVLDSEDHKPKRNENNSCGIMQQHKLLFLIALSCPVLGNFIS